jgi:hypothetical protein
LELVQLAVLKLNLGGGMKSFSVSTTAAPLANE